MASTVTAATLTVKVTESISLNGTPQGASNTLTIASINEISKRIVTITTAESTVATFSAAIAAGNYIAANVRYIRFTNLDDTNFITLTFRNQDNDEVAIKLDAGQSFIWNADNSGGMVDVFNATEDADAASDTNLGDLTNIQADANSGSCDLEMFIASV
jgi:voltage-gated potassium channel Kch